MSKIFRFTLLSIAVMLLLFSFGTQVPILAQAGATTSSVTGLVKDQTGAALSGATVKIRNIVTNITQEVTVGEDGFYTLTNLPPSTYEVSINVEGFSPQRIKIDLDLGAKANVDLTLSVGSATGEVIEVVADASVNQSRTESSTNQDRGRIDNLPINQRNFLDFAVTSARVITDRIPSNGITATSGISFNGQSARLNNVQIDGSSNNDTTTGGVLSTFSQDAVQEFQIVSDSYSAEFGRAVGGVVNIITRSGGNDLHGRVFGLVRTDSTSARDVFATFEPEFKQYQAGGTLSGPVKKDKSFFFLSFERLSVKQSAIVTIPDSIIAGAKRQGYTDVDNGAVPFSIGTTSVLARSDTQINPSNRLSVRYNGGFSFNSAFETTLGSLGGLVSPTAGGILRLKDNSIVANNTYTKSSLVNETRFLFTTRRQTVENFGIPNPTTILIGDFQTPQSIFGSNFLTPVNRKVNIYQLVDNVSISKGRNDLKFGIDGLLTDLPNRESTFAIQTNGFNIFAPIDFSAALGMPGLPFFSTLQTFDPASRTPAQLGFLQALSQILPTVVPNFPVLPLDRLALPVISSQLFGNPNISIRKSSFSAFIQDDFKFRPNFLIKAGLRYDIIRTSVVPNNSGNFSPRVAFSYTFNKLDNKLTMYGSYGIFFGNGAPLLTSFLSGIYNSSKTSFDPNSGTIQRLIFPLSILPYAQPKHIFQTPAPPIFIKPLLEEYQTQPDIRNSYSNQVTYGFRYLAEKNTLISLEYNFFRGLKLINLRYINPVVNQVPNNPLLSAITGRVDPTKGLLLESESAFDSYYNAVSLTLNRRFANRFSLLFSYTFSKSIDNFVDFRPDLAAPNDALKPAQERGLSVQDTRSRFVASGTWDLSYGNNQLLKGFQLSAILQLVSGRPYDVQSGLDLNGSQDLIPSDRPPASGLLSLYSPDCGCIIGRNAGITPGFAQLDIRLTRSFTINEKVKIEGLFEMFNAFNRVNISQFNSTFAPDLTGNFNLPPQEDGRYIVPRGRFSNAFAPRQIQLGFRVSF